MGHGVDIFVAVQRVLPKHALSRIIGTIAESKRPWLINLLIKRAISAFGINMQEAASDNLEDYESFNAFFTRALKDDARVVDGDPKSVCCPADGVISQAGIIDKTRILQAKGLNYSISRLLGNSVSAQRFNNGSFATIYLSPKDYHRVHMPVSGTLRATRYIPGELFSVNDKTAQGLEELFARNERLVCEFESESAGNFVVVFVGAMLVAGIETVWGGFEKPGPGAVRESDFSDRQLAYDKGEEIGQFKFGSTAIILFEKDRVTGLETLNPQSPVLMGQQLASLVK